jgi:phage terminase small subunit
MPKTAGLTKKQERFVQEYLQDPNATKAAIRAGYSERNAAQLGYQLLQKTSVSTAITQALGATAGERKVTALRTIRECEHRAFLDPADLFDEEGHLRPIHEIPPHVRRSIESVEVKRLRGRQGKEPQEIVKIKLWSRGDAVDKLAKLLGLYRDNAPQAEAHAQVHIYLPQKGSMADVIPGESCDSPEVLALPPKAEDPR